MHVFNDLSRYVIQYKDLTSDDDNRQEDNRAGKITICFNIFYLHNNRAKTGLKILKASPILFIFKHNK